MLKLLDQLEEEGGGGGETINTNNVTVLLDLAFANNVRFLDEHEMYLTDQVELSKTLPFACGMAMARGISDSLMSAAYFNGSALRFLRSVLPPPRRSPGSGSPGEPPWSWRSPWRRAPDSGGATPPPSWRGGGGWA